MMDHRSLHAWRVARRVALGVLEAARHEWKPWAAALFAQLQRASLSVQLNIAEGYTFNQAPSYTRHLAIAYGSAVETAELLELALESGAIPEERVKPLIQLSRRSQRLLLGMLKKRRPMPPRHRPAR